MWPTDEPLPRLRERRSPRRGRRLGGDESGAGMTVAVGKFPSSWPIFLDNSSVFAAADRVQASSLRHDVGALNLTFQ